MKLVYGGYGHNPSGKQYVYWAGDNYRTGQNVVVPVKHWKSGKTFNTMFTIQRTSGIDTEHSQDEIVRLGETQNERNPNGIFLKGVESRDVMSLPGAVEFDSAKAWREEAKKRYADERAERVKLYANRNVTKQNSQQVANANYQQWAKQLRTNTKYNEIRQGLRKEMAQEQQTVPQQTYKNNMSGADLRRARLMGYSSGTNSRSARNQLLSL